ncbi:hypothetical protein N0V94_001311 [Neodidymelliopsis sp. IMI 364377]|nr:hypothetical protein N0V94_001311 [Neodidymelliopsis sp. IMI 364377]
MLPIPTRLTAPLESSDYGTVDLYDIDSELNLNVVDNGINIGNVDKELDFNNADVSRVINNAEGDGLNIDNARNDGFDIGNAEDDGPDIGNSEDDGINIDNAEDDRLDINNADDDGLDFSSGVQDNARRAENISEKTFRIRRQIRSRYRRKDDELFDANAMKQVSTRLKRKLPEDEDLLDEYLMDEDILDKENSKASSTKTLDTTRKSKYAVYPNLGHSSSLRNSPDFTTPDFPTTDFSILDFPTPDSPTPNLPIPDTPKPDLLTSKTPYTSFMGQSPPLFANTRTMCYLETDSGKMTAITGGVGFEINNFVQFINAHKQPDMDAIQHSHVSLRERFQYPRVNKSTWTKRIPSATYVLPSAAAKLSRMYKLHGFVRRLRVYAGSRATLKSTTYQCTQCNVPISTAGNTEEIRAHAVQVHSTLAAICCNICNSLVYSSSEAK